MSQNNQSGWLAALHQGAFAPDFLQQVPSFWISPSKKHAQQPLAVARSNWLLRPACEKMARF